MHNESSNLGIRNSIFCSFRLEEGMWIFVHGDLCSKSEACSFAATKLYLAVSTYALQLEQSLHDRASELFSITRN